MRACLALLMFLASAGMAAAQTCDRLRVTSPKGDARLQGLYDFCNDYRRLQAEVARLTQQVEALQRTQAEVQRLRRVVEANKADAGLVRDPRRAVHKIALTGPSVLIATGYADGAVTVSVDGAACVAGTGHATCQRPLDPGKRTVAASGREVTLSVVVLAR